MTKREFDKLRKLLIKYNKIRHNALKEYQRTHDIEAYYTYINFTRCYFDIYDLIIFYE